MLTMLLRWPRVLNALCIFGFLATTGGIWGLYDPADRVPHGTVCPAGKTLWQDHNSYCLSDGELARINRLRGVSFGFMALAGFLSLGEGAARRFARRNTGRS